MAQTWRVRTGKQRKPRPPLDGEALERSALFYVGRYATTRAKLASYLGRKLGERGWAGKGDAPVAALVERFSALGYVDDRAFAAARSAALQRRGYGERRIGAALRAAGIAEGDAEEARSSAEAGAFAAALRFAARRKLGPYAAAPADRAAREKNAAAMARAGHRFDIVRRVLDLSPGEIPDGDGD